MQGTPREAQVPRERKCLLLARSTLRVEDAQPKICDESETMSTMKAAWLKEGINVKAGMITVSQEVERFLRS